MKEIKKLTDAELQERLAALDGLVEAENLRKQIKDEIAAREEAREAEKREAAKEVDKALLRKQHDVLGKHYLVGNKAYKVVGVVMNRVFLEYTATYKVREAETEFKTYTALQIDELLKNGKEITKEEYANHKTDINQAIDDVTKSLRETFYENRDIFGEFGEMFKNLKNFLF